MIYKNLIRNTISAFRKSRYYPVISTGAMRSIAQRRNLFLWHTGFFA